MTDKIIEELESYKNIPDKWYNGEEGDKIDHDIIAKGIEYYKIAKNLEISCEPCMMFDGGISLTFFMEDYDHFLDIILNNNENKTIDMRYEIGKGSNYTISKEKEEISETDIVTELQDYLITYKTLKL